MSTQDNVVKIPALLERLAERALRAAHAYEAGLAKRDEVRATIVAAVIEYGNALREGRAQYASDKEFGQWVKSKGLDRIKPFDDQRERTAAMQIAEISTHGNTAVGSCPRSRPTHMMSWWRDRQREKQTKVGEREARPRKAKASPTRDQVKDVVRAHKTEHGAYPTRDQIMDVVGKVANATADQALGEVRAEDETRAQSKAEHAEDESLNAVKLTKAQQSHIDIVVRRRVREVEKEAKAREAIYETRVRAEASRLFEAAKEKAFPSLQERSNRAFRMEAHWNNMINNHKPIFTEEEFNVIRACLHPDNSASAEKRATAFSAFNAMKLQLTGKK